jgi:hypothetical protein
MACSTPIMRKRAIAKAAERSHFEGGWWVGWVLLGWLILAASAAVGQETPTPLPNLAQPNPPAQTAQAAPGPASGVIKPPAHVDPGIRIKPNVPPAALPMPIIPPPGTPGGNPNVQPK